MVALQHAVQAMSGLCARLYQPVAMGHQSTQLAHFLRRHPHRGNEIGRKSTGQCNRITRVRLHARSGNQLDRLRMSDHYFCDQRLSLIIQQPRIGRRLKHDRIRVGEMDLSPRGL
jgi:hypothetical protein